MCERDNTFKAALDTKYEFFNRSAAFAALGSIGSAFILWAALRFGQDMSSGGIIASSDGGQLYSSRAYIMDRGIKVYIDDTGGYTQALDWSEECGNVAYFEIEDRAYRLYVLNLHNLEKENIGVISADDLHASFSKENCNLIVFASPNADHDGSDIYVADVEAGSMSRVTVDSHEESHPVWLDGQIYFLSNRDGKRDLFSIDTDGSNLVNITNDKEHQSMLYSDGENIYYFTCHKHCEKSSLPRSK